MKKLLLAICSLSLVISAHAQVKTPDKYIVKIRTNHWNDRCSNSRPRVKGRKILVISYPLIKLGVPELIKIPFLLFNTMLE